MSKPEFTKPFDIISAKAGAPYCCASGDEATIIKWDGRQPGYPIIGITSNEDIPCVWSAVGIGSYACDQLVMLPLGMIDGKPVFVGDKYLGHADTECVAGPGMSSDWSGCKWPAPARAYPVTQMTGGQLRSRYNEEMGGPVSEVMIRVANAALRHACDAGQVVDLGYHTEEMSRSFLMGADTAHERGDARDMAIALAVWNACRRKLLPESERMQDINLAAIIARVKP